MKACGENAASFIDMLVDITKYELCLRRVDPMFREMDDIYVPGPNGQRIKLAGWQKFCERTYDRLVSEESRESSAASRRSERDVEWIDSSLLDAPEWEIEGGTDGIMMSDDDEDLEDDEDEDIAAMTAISELKIRKEKDV